MTLSLRRLLWRTVASVVAVELLLVAVSLVPHPFGFYWACVSCGIIGARAVEHLR